MAVEIAKLLSQVAPILIPYVAKGAGEFTSESDKKLAEALYEKFKPKIEAKESATEAVQDLKSAPQDEDAQASLRQQIKKILVEDPDFATDISITVGEMHISSVRAGAQSIAVGAVGVSGNINNSNLVIGKDNKVIHADTYIQGNVYNGPAPRNPQDALKIYRTIVANSTSSLPMRGIDVQASDPTSPQKPINLSHVYIALNTTIQIQINEKYAEKIKQKTGKRLILEKDRPLSVLDAVIQNRWMVIKGDPGSGKSTFVNYLANCLATQQTAMLEGWQEEEIDLLPIIVVLRDFAKSLPGNLPKQAQPRHLWDFVHTRLRAQNLAASAKSILEILDKGKAIVFLDGLDEVPTTEKRVFVRDAVHAFINRYSENRFLATCRVLSYQPPKTRDEADLRLVNFPEFELAAFNDKQISTFIDGWYEELSNLRTGTPEEAQDSAHRLKTAIGQRPELRRLAQNPLLLTVMTLVNTHKGRLPDARAVLYRETIDILLWRWEQGSKGQKGQLRQLLLEADCADTDLEQIIWKLAYDAHAQTYESDSEESLAGIGELTLQKSLAAINKGDLNWAARVIETMKLRAGLLLERDNGVFTFPHRSFQEFLAGMYLESKDDFVPRAKELANNQLLWRQTILWAVSYRVYIRGSNDGPLALVAELCPARVPVDEVSWSKVWLAGDILHEIGLSRVERSELGNDLLPRVQNRLIQLIEQNHLAPRERAEAGDTLAKLGDSRPGVIPVFSWAQGLEVGNSILFCKISTGKFLMGNTEETDFISDDNERPQIEYDIKHDFFISRYPITNAQFDLFVNDPNGYTNENWYTKEGKEWYRELRPTRPPKHGGVFDLPNHPVVRVTWHESVAFTHWLTNKLRNEDPTLKIWTEGEIYEFSVDFTRWELRLPSEAEWEKAARGANGHRYPWGDDFQPEKVNCQNTIGSTSAVGCFPSGQSPYGLLDMSGNVWEWCNTQWTEKGYKSYSKNENNEVQGEARRVVRGGSFGGSEKLVRCAFRHWFYQNNRSHDLGFRVVVSLA